MERHAWAAERERLTARITSLQRAVQAREIKVAAAREAVEAERNATVRRVAARENAAVAAVEWLTRVPEPDDILVTMGAAATRGRAEGDEAAVEWLTRAPEPNDEGAIPQPFHSHSTRITRPRRQQSTFERQPHSTHRARLGTLAPARSSLPAES